MSCYLVPKVSFNFLRGVGVARRLKKAIPNAVILDQCVLFSIDLLYLTVTTGTEMWVPMPITARHDLMADWV